MHYLFGGGIGITGGVIGILTIFRSAIKGGGFIGISPDNLGRDTHVAIKRTSEAQILCLEAQLRTNSPIYSVYRL